MTFDQLTESRTAAIAAYEAAVVTLRAAFVELAALDRAVSNGKHFGGHSQIVRSFAADLALPGHPDANLPPWQSAPLIQSRADQLI